MPLRGRGPVLTEFRAEQQRAGGWVCVVVISGRIKSKIRITIGIPLTHASSWGCCGSHFPDCSIPAIVEVGEAFEFAELDQVRAVGAGFGDVDAAEFEE